MKAKVITAALAVAAMAASQAAPAHAANLFFSETGSGTQCSQSLPCSINQAITDANPYDGYYLACADSSESFTNFTTITGTMTIDCSGTRGGIGNILISAPGKVVTLRNLTINGANDSVVLGSGTVILENVHLHDNYGSGISAQPNGPSTLIVRNSVIDASSPGGALLAPLAGGSLSVVFDHVTVSASAGFGIKVDTTHGPVTVELNDSIVSNNGGNGINAVGGVGGQAMVNIKNSVIAKNGTAGVQANGANAAVLVQTTLLDQNVAGATSVVNGGHISTYGNNSVVGSAGSGFTGSAPLQ